MIKKLYILTLGILLAGCVAAKLQTLTSADEVEASISCITDEFSGLTTCEIPEKNTCTQTGTDTVMNCAGSRTVTKLKMAHKNGKDAEFAITGYVFSSGWAFSKRALDKDGNQLDFEQFDSDILGGGTSWTKEHFVITLPKDYISKHQNDGISIKIYGTRVSSRIEIPAEYTQGMLNYMKSNGIK